MSWTPPPQLITYLTRMISPPAPDPAAEYWPDLAEVDWAAVAATPTATLAGLITRGTPTEPQSAELLRILRPGAHLLLIAPEDEHWGATGACRVEDAGFEIRDALLVALPRAEGEPCSFHYTAKASREERELGCQNLDDDVNGIKNTHPTVKPVELMARLLRDVPRGPDVPAPPPGATVMDVLDPNQVLDPFMGSGSTGVACMEVGLSFRGIDREKNYVEISHARMQHWKSQAGGKRGTKGIKLGDGAPVYYIISDVEGAKEEAESFDFEDFLG